MIRRFLFKIHLILGLSIGLHLVVLGVTGTFLVWNREADTQLQPYLISKNIGQREAPLEQVVQAFEKAAPGQDVGRLRRKSADGVWGVTIKDPKSIARHIYVNPYSAEVIGVRTRTSSVNGWISWVHFNLFAGEIGELVNGYGAVLSAISLASGLYLWWPKTLSLLRQGLTVKRGASLKRKMHDWHNMAGICSLGVLLLTCVTVMVFAWIKPVSNAIFALTGSKPEPKIKIAPHGERLSHSRLYLIGDAAIAGRWVSSVDLPKKATKPFVLRKDLPTSERWRGSLSVFLDLIPAKSSKSATRATPHSARGLWS